MNAVVYSFLLLPHTFWEVTLYGSGDFCPIQIYLFAPNWKTLTTNALFHYKRPKEQICK